ncbi:MAG: cytochrome P450 [Planctomycetota bacterium]
MPDATSKPSNVSPVPGSYGTSFFPRPFWEALQMLTAQGKYVEGKTKKAGGATVFKAHPGLPTILICNNVSAEFFFKAADDVVQREAIQRFGLAAPRQVLIEHTDTAILTSGELHTRSRGLFDEIFQSRIDQMLPAFERHCIAGIAKWPTAGKLPIEESFQRITAPFFFQWLLDVTPNIDDVLSWQKHLIVPTTDSCLSNLIFKLIARVPSETVAGAKRMTQVALSSPLMGKYMEWARKHGFQDDANVARALVFNCAFNMSAGLSRFLLPSMSAISINTQVRAKLVRELDAWDPDKTNVDDLPYLNAVSYECLRLYPWPRFIHKKAQRDFVLPAENGRSYQIHKGELLMSFTPFAHRDPTVFKGDPLAFRPERFIDDPGLENKVFTFGWAKDQKQTYGCAGRVSAQILWKMLVAHLLKNYDWQVRGAELNINNALDVSPKDVALEDFKKR